MSRHASAPQYARAMFDSALKQTDPVRVGDELDAAVALMRAHPELDRVLRSPVVTAEAKHNVLREIAARAGWSKPLAQLLEILASGHELHALPALTAEYRRLLQQHQQIVEAEVTTAVPLPDGRAASLAGTLSSTTGKRVSISTRVDPGILGGIVTRIGSVVYDGSVVRQLERMRERLVEGA
jgi:F-type H+-transporting ATPase subunit delta